MPDIFVDRADSKQPAPVTEAYTRPLYKRGDFWWGVGLASAVWVAVGVMG